MELETEISANTRTEIYLLQNGYEVRNFEYKGT